MAIELAATQQNGIVKRSETGEIEMARGYGKHLTQADRNYLSRTNNDIVALNMTAEKLAAKADRVQRRLKQSADALELANLKRKLKLVRHQHQEKITKAMGVIESALQNSGQDLETILTDSIVLPPSVKRGRPRRELTA